MKKLLSVLFLGLVAVSAFGEEKPKGDAPKTQTVKFDLVSSGHFIVKVKLNDSGPYNLIFDTGAPTTLINPKIAKEAKLLKDAKDKPLLPLFGMMGSVNVDQFMVGDVTAKGVSAQVMDHPTVKLFSEEYKDKYGSIDGIVGFGFFARYKMTVDYSKKELTFTPNEYVPEDVMQSMMRSVSKAMSSTKKEARVAPAQAVFGFMADKKAKDENPGVDVTEIFSGGAVEEAGIKKGDRLLTLDGRWTDTVGDLLIAIENCRANAPVVAVVKRDGKEVKVKVTPRPGI